jgi:hypothetical protein
MRGLRRAGLALAVGWLAAAQAQDGGQPREQQREQPAPDLDFLEYLGAWAEDDDEWLAIETWERDNGEEAGEDSEEESEDDERDEDDDSE